MNEEKNAKQIDLADSVGITTMAATIASLLKKNKKATKRDNK